MKEYIEIPKYCPICGGETYIEQLNDSEVLKCGNPQCEGKLTNKVDHFLGKRGLDAKGISKATIEKLIDWGWVNTISDVFNLSDRKNEWIAKPGFGEKSVNNIIESIRTSSNTDLESIISAAGIPLIGRTVAREIVKNFSTYKDFREAINGDFDFSTLPSFGYEMNKALKTYDYTELDIIVENYLKIAEPEQTDFVQVIGETDLTGFTYCITGKLNHFKNRDELTKEIEKHGGKVVSSMSKNVNFLINNDVNSTSAKNKKAKELGIPILDESQMLDILDFGKNF